MIVTGMDIKVSEINFCPKCGAFIKENGIEGHYHDGQYIKCHKCYTHIEVGIDGRDW